MIANFRSEVYAICEDRSYHLYLTTNEMFSRIHSKMYYFERSSSREILLTAILSLVCFSWFVNSRANLVFQESDLLKSGLEEKYDAWLKTFKAADPSQQEMCINALRGLGAKAQYGQDLYIFFNVFKYWPMQGKKGFYVDSGTNDPITDSNSYFYDRCLGWDGICVEPQAHYHERIIQTRSCSLVKGCLASKPVAAKMEGSGGMAKVVHEAQTSSDVDLVHCHPLVDLLREKGRTTIDLWSLDVEGAEIDILENLDFNEVHVQSILIEDFWVPLRDLDYLMTTRGFYKLQQLAVDSFYLNRSTPFLEPLWHPHIFDKHWKAMKEWRYSLPSEQLKC